MAVRTEMEKEAAVIFGGMKVAWMRVAVVELETSRQIEDVLMVELMIGLTGRN